VATRNVVDQYSIAATQSHDANQYSFTRISFGLQAGPYEAQRFAYVHVAEQMIWKGIVLKKLKFT
jgi:hypothetical protein